MSTIKTTAPLPNGPAFWATLGSRVKLDNQFTIIYDDRDSLQFDLGNLYFTLSRDQWEVLKEAADTLLAQAVSAWSV